MKKKLLLVLLVVLALSFTLAACEKIDDHKHAFSDVWTYDENYHWHKATCEHADEISDKAVHDMEAVPSDKTVMKCKVCDYTCKSDHVHTYATEYAADENCHWLPTTCGCLVENAAPHHFVDGICVTCGWWSSASEVLFAKLNRLDVWNYVLTLDNLNLGLLSPNFEGITAQKGELKLSLSESGELSGSGYFEVHAENGADGFMKAVLNDGVIYAYSEGIGLNDDDYYRISFADFAEQAGIDVKEIESYLNELDANTQQIRGYLDELNHIVSALPVDDAILAELLNSLVKEDLTKSTNDLSAYVIDATFLRSINGALATTTVSQYVNAALGGLQGTPLGVLLGDDFYGLPDKIYSLLKRTILQTKADLGAADFTTDDLINQLNGIISAYYPDKNVNTVDELLLSLGIDIAQLGKFLGISNVSNLTVKQLIDACSLASPEALWNMFQQDNSTKINSDEIKLQLEELCQAYGEKTVYDIIVENSEYTAEQLKTAVDGIADWLDESTPVVFYVDGDMVLQQITVEADGQTAALKRNGELEQDYSQVISIVNANYCEHEYRDGDCGCIRLGDVCSDGVIKTATCGKCNRIAIVGVEYEHNLTTKRLTLFDNPSAEHLFVYTECSECGKVIDVIHTEFKETELTDADRENGVLRKLACGRDIKCTWRIEEVAVGQRENYALTEIRIYEGDTLTQTLNSVYCYDSESGRPLNQHNHNYNEFNYVVNDGLTCVNGLTVFIGCEECGDELEISNLNVHVLNEIRLALPESACKEHYVFVYECKACGLQSGMGVDAKLMNGRQYNDETYPDFMTDCVCEDCGLHVTYTVLSATEEYLLCDVVVKCGSEILYSGTNITYLDTYNSFPLKQD